MGKVKDGAPASKASKPSKGGATGGGSKRRKDFALFVMNLVSAKLHKPMQGRHARIYTAAGLGVVVALGLWRLYDTLLAYSPAVRFGIPTALGLALAWFIFRLVEYPPFVEFLIATEAEMNKVSWTSRKQLIKDTLVVLVFLLLLTLFLFVIDTFWAWLLSLKFIGVLPGKGEAGEAAASGGKLPW
jgi:preprotein translocase subunit SecE